MKTILSIFLLTVSIGFAQAQDAVPIDQPMPGPAVFVPAVVYQAPVFYAAPVVYQAPVTYTAPVYYLTGAAAATIASCVAPAVCAPPVCAAPAPCGPVCPPELLCAAYHEECAPRSEVIYIGGGHVGYQFSRPACGSTLTFIGSGRR